MHYPYLEGIAVEAEVALDPAHQALDTGVRPDGAAAPARSMGADHSRAESFLIGAAHGLLQGAPVRALNLLQKLRLSHENTPL